ncbi:ubiquinone biosynthesis hydroxylase [Pseudolabrys sp. FHR47]|uniref:ubiquinone biosynthesis hydroxylase n=1 Tax=Pseudolabrys sp. FHR47 TaxID=2562284 RepID=UPI0010BEC073|nr:ubiquinone biosynthesis hydroxylase [Pseudolabrys sp. FHR47]
MLQRNDLVIGGAGFAGLALAIALRQALGERFAITVADPALAQVPSKDPRATAIAAAARRLFEAIEVWDAVAPTAQPILDMVVTDSKLDDVVRPTFLTFGGEVEEGEPFAHMVENRYLIDALVKRAKDMGIDLRATAVSRYETTSKAVVVTFADGNEIEARLLVGADGARSAIREQAGIATHGWSYGQSGIVTTVEHERPHNGCAEEHFLPAGPFAILPLTGNRVSIVWTERTRDAERIVALPDDEFHTELEKRFGLHLGELKIAGPRRAYPLGLYNARSFIADRLALIGDAAHVIHPIAGQGLNMGLRDVAALAESIADVARLGLDIGGPQVLERYQRWRRFDTMTMSVATDGLNRLFSNHSNALRLVRDIGLGLVERMPELKRTFIREAAGVTGEVPKLMKGEMV